MILFYVRHGDPSYSPDQLTALGRRQAEAAARRLSIHGIDRIFSSTSTRAYRTALPTAEVTKNPITQLDWAHEDHAWDDFSLVKPDGVRTWCFFVDEIRQLFATKELRDYGDKWYEHPQLIKYERFKPGIERIDREVDAFIASLGYEHDREKGIYKLVRPNNERVALFAHEGVGALFLSSLLDIPYPTFSNHFGMTHTAITMIAFDDNGGYSVPRVLTYANDSHLYHNSLPAVHHNHWFNVRF